MFKYTIISFLSIVSLYVCFVGYLFFYKSGTHEFNQFGIYQGSYHLCFDKDKPKFIIRKNGKVLKKIYKPNSK